MRQALVFISPVTTDEEWHRTLKAVKVSRHCSWKGVGCYVHMASFSVGVPQRLKVTTDDGTVVAHGEVRNLGPHPNTRASLVGLSNIIVTEGFRHRGIYTAILRLGNLLADHFGFDCVAVRVKVGYEDRYIAEYPDFRKVKDQDPYGAAWFLRLTPQTHLKWDHIAHIVKYLETDVKKW